MPEGAKFLFSAATILVVVVLICFVDSGDRGARDAHFWRGGSNDLVRRIIMRPNGKFRRYTKVSFAIFAALFVAAIWIFA